MFHFMFNAWWLPLSFELPELPRHPGVQWRRWLDTSLPSPSDIVPMEEAEPAPGGSYQLPPRSVAALFARLPAHEEPSAVKGEWKASHTD